MKELKCSKCCESKEVIDFDKANNKKRGYSTWCKLCYANYNKTKHDGIYTVYYLPEEHYCGYTKSYDRRLQKHKSEGKDISKAKVLFASKDWNTAVHHEAMFQSYLGIEGLNTNNKSY